MDLEESDLYSAVNDAPLLSVQACFRSSAFKPVTPKNFSSMQNLYPSSKSEDADHGISNGLHRAYAHVAKAVSTSSSSSSPSRHGGPTPGGNKVSLIASFLLIKSSLLINSAEICHLNGIHCIFTSYSRPLAFFFSNI